MYKREISIYLVQRGTINRPIAEYRGQRISQAVDFDYMGSAEFEFGALPKSLRAIEANTDRATLRVVPEIKSGASSLRVFSVMSDKEFAEYLPKLIDLRAGKKTHTKEYTAFNADYTSEYSKTDFWWDIENHTMFSFDKHFMNSIIDCVGASLTYMNTPK